MITTRRYGRNMKKMFTRSNSKLKIINKIPIIILKKVEGQSNLLITDV